MLVLDRLISLMDDITPEELQERLIDEVYSIIDDCPDLELKRYQDILVENGLPLDGTHRPEEANVERWDLQGVLGLLVAIVRQERFNDGLIAEQIKLGTIQRCLKRIKEIGNDLK